MSELKVGEEVAAWTCNECDLCGIEYPVTRCSVKVITERDFICESCHEANDKAKLAEQVEKLSPLVEIVSNQKQRIQQLEEELQRVRTTADRYLKISGQRIIDQVEQLAASKAEIAEYRDVITKALIWMYHGDVPDGCEGEAEALGLMNNSFLDVLAKHKGE